MEELWKAIPGFEGYEISSKGRARCCLGVGTNQHKEQPRGSWRLLAICDHNQGYKVVSLYNRRKEQKICLLHRVVWEAFNGPIPALLQIDHKDRDKENNNLENLRICTQNKNNTNSVSRNQKNGKYRGVRPHGNKWTARIKVNKKEVHLGSFPSDKEAAIAYNEAALTYFGDFVVFNII